MTGFTTPSDHVPDRGNHTQAQPDRCGADGPGVLQWQQWTSRLQQVDHGQRAAKELQVIYDYAVLCSAMYRMRCS